MRWLGELAEALAEAQVLTWALGTIGRNVEALEVYGEIELLVGELQSLRLGGRLDLTGEKEPDWSKHLPWTSA